jgi:hypothetical protein
MEFAPVVVLVHALTGVLFIVGLIGRWIVLGAAERATTLTAMRTLTNAARPFERIVIVSSGLVLLLGVVSAIAQGRNLIGPLSGGTVDWLFVSLVLFVSNLPLVPLVFLPRGKIFDAALAEAETRGGITPGLTAAWSDPVVRGAHLYELATSTVILVLMLAKPF